jgi:hypothetical protein
MLLRPQTTPFYRHFHHRHRRCCLTDLGADETTIKINILSVNYYASNGSSTNSAHRCRQTRAIWTSLFRASKNIKTWSFVASIYVLKTHDLKTICHPKVSCWWGGTLVEGMIQIPWSRHGRNRDLISSHRQKYIVRGFAFWLNLIKGQGNFLFLLPADSITLWITSPEEQLLSASLADTIDLLSWIILVWHYPLEKQRHAC